MLQLTTKFAALFALFAVSPALHRAPAVHQDDAANPELTERGRESYLGREIAQTMHWTGAQWLLRETREKEENSALLESKLGLATGQSVCDLGCGNGYFTLPIAEQVGATGRVYGVDIQREMLTLLERRVEAAGLDNVEAILGTVSDPKLPEASCDLVLMVDVYHEISHPVTVLAHLRRALKPGGRLLFVEFRLEDPEVPIKLEHKMSKAQLIAEMSANGFVFRDEFDGLPWQHLISFVRDPEFPREAGQELADAKAIAAGIERAWKNADAATLAGFCAPEVFVLGGSALLGPSHGEEDEVSTEDRTLARDDWLRRHRELFSAEPNAPWRAATSKSEFTVTPAATTSWPSFREGDLVLRSRGDEHELELFLRRTPAGLWQVVAERADF